MRWVGAKRKGWYIALRFTDMLIQSKAFESLDDLFNKLPCKKDEDFLCGFYAQLELSWSKGRHRDDILRFCENTLNPAASASKYQRVHKWVDAMSMTVGRDWVHERSPRSSVKLLGRTPLLHNNVRLPTLAQEQPQTDLLETAWIRCTRAQVYYADVMIRDFYLQGKHVKVERLSGVTLPMDQCYVNLVVIEHSSPNDTPGGRDTPVSGSSPFSLFSRLKIETPHENRRVDLPTLFKPREIGQKGVTEPQRILIRGQAGAGKTTLCKKLVHDYIKEDMWRDRFARIIWVPLRSFKSESTLPNDKLEAWIERRYFPGPTRDGKILAQAVIHAVSDPIRHGKTLFILDGLDEVSRELSSGTSGVLDLLLRQDSVIFTSRPSISFSCLEKLDLEIETIGFYPDQVQSYIRRVVPEYASDIEAFIEMHWIIQGLVRIPIQLEALCFSWDTGVAKTPTVPRTMTELYQSIVAKLWRKDAARLDKPYSQGVLTDQLARELHADEIEEHVGPEDRFIQCLAFTGIVNEILEFDPGFIGAIRSQSRKDMSPTDELPPSLSLGKLSFLRTSDSSVEERYRTYHFLHLTFQEYYAARYFVNHWHTKDMRIYSLDNGKLKAETMSCQDFLKRQKYNSRYDVMWRFVTGLMHGAGHDSHLCRLFDVIEADPRDLLGSVHQRLVMHCLSEVPEGNEWSTFAARRKALQNMLQKWLIFECKLNGQSGLAAEVEFPSSILEKLLHSESKRRQRAILKSLTQRTRISQAIISIIDGLLRDPEWDVRSAAAEVLGNQPDLPVAVVKSLAGLLRDPEPYMRWVAAKALGNLPDLPVVVMESLIGLIQDPESNVRRDASGAVGNQPDLSAAATESLAGLLRDPESDVRSAAAEALRNHPDLPVATAERLVGLVRDPKWNVRWAAAKALGNQRDLPASVTKSLVGLLQDPESDV
jgi:hypothetical protein